MKGRVCVAVQPGLFQLGSVLRKAESQNVLVVMVQTIRLLASCCPGGKGMGRCANSLDAIQEGVRSMCLVQASASPLKGKGSDKPCRQSCEGDSNQNGKQNTGRTKRAKDLDHASNLPFSGCVAEQPRS